jgi:hypothetical protein
VWLVPAKIDNTVTRGRLSTTSNYNLKYVCHVVPQLPQDPIVVWTIYLSDPQLDQTGTGPCLDFFKLERSSYFLIFPATNNTLGCTIFGPKQGIGWIFLLKDLVTRPLYYYHPLQKYSLLSSIWYEVGELNTCDKY